MDKKAEKQVTDDYDYLGAACSSMDCTGLIPRGVVNPEELEAYEALYPYQPPILDQKDLPIR